VTQETDALQTLTSKRDKARASIPDLEKAVAKAAEAMTGFPKGTPVSEIVAKSGALATAQALLEGAQGDIKRANKGLDALVALEKREAVTNIILPVGSLFAPAAKALPKGCKATGTVPPAMYAKHAAELEAAGVKSVTFTLDSTIDPPQGSVKPSGGLPKAPRGDGGGGRKNSWSYQGGTFTSEELCREYADEGPVAKVDDAKAAGKSVSFAHLAESTANRIGAVKSEA